MNKKLNYTASTIILIVTGIITYLWDLIPEGHFAFSVYLGGILLLLFVFGLGISIYTLFDGK